MEMVLVTFQGDYGPQESPAGHGTAPPCSGYGPHLHMGQTKDNRRFVRDEAELTEG